MQSGNGLNATIERAVSGTFAVSSSLPGIVSLKGSLNRGDADAAACRGLQLFRVSRGNGMQQLLLGHTRKSLLARLTTASMKRSHLRPTIVQLSYGLFASFR